MRKNTVWSGVLAKLTVLAFIAPLATVALWSVAKSWPWPELLPTEYSTRGLSHVFRPSSGAVKSLVTSFKLSAVVTFLSLVASVLAGKSLGIYEFRGKRVVKLLSMAPIIVPSMAVAMGIHSVFIKLGLSNSFAGVVLVHMITTIPYGIRIFTDIFEITGERLEDQARVLGAGPFKAFIYITLPVISPGIASAGSLMFIVSFSQYFLTFLIGGGNLVTYPMMMVPYIQSGDRSMASAYSLVFVAVTLVILFAIEKGVKLYYGDKDKFYF